MTIDEPRTTVYFTCRHCQELVKSQMLPSGETKEEGHRRDCCPKDEATG